MYNGSDGEASAAFEKLYRDWEIHRPGVLERYGLAMIPFDMTLPASTDHDEERMRKEQEASEKRLSEWARNFKFSQCHGTIDEKSSD